MSIASTFSDIDYSRDHKIDILVKVDPLLTVVSCDITMFRTILINAMHIAFKNIRNGTMNTKFSIAQSIVIQVNVLSPKGECELKKLDTLKRAPGLVSFNSVHLMMFQIFDTGSFDDNTNEAADAGADDDSEDYSIGSHEHVCQDLINKCSTMFQCCPKKCTFNLCFSRDDISKRGGVYKCLQEFTIPFTYNAMSVKVRRDKELMSLNDYISTKKDNYKQMTKSKKWQQKMSSYKMKMKDDYDENVGIKLTNTFSILILFFASDDSSDYYRVQLIERAVVLQKLFESYYWNCSYLICNESTAFGSYIDNCDCFLIDIKSYKSYDIRGCLEITDRLQLLRFMFVIAGLGDLESNDPYLERRLNFDPDEKIRLDDSVMSYEMIQQSMNNLIRKCNRRLHSLLIGEAEGRGIYRSIFSDDLYLKKEEKERMEERKEKTA